MMKIEDTINLIKSTKDCTVLQPSGIPKIKDGHKFPEDVLLFYELCGGATLFESSNLPLYIVTPEKFVSANAVIVGAPYEEDISSFWYIIADDGTDSQRITIDLDEERLGRCYDSFWDRHAISGSSTIISLSFSEFLMRSFEEKGNEFYWLRKDFPSYGDAYLGKVI